MVIISNILYDTRDVAEFLKVSPITIKRYIAGNKIKSKKINGLRRFKGADILKLADMNRPADKFIGLRTIDLFAGVGGIRLGFEKAGFKTVFANDFDSYCKITYDLNFSGSKLTIDDIREIDINSLPEFDFLLAGFPCQAFSIAGYRKGFDDEKKQREFIF